MALRSTLLLLVLTCVMGIIAAERHAKDSCMVHWIVQSGVSHSKAVNVERRMIQVDSSPADVTGTPLKFVSYLLKTTLADSNKLRSCFAGTSAACRKYSPCQHRGKCTMSLSKKQYVCNCPRDYNGDFCQTPQPAPLRDLRVLEKEVKKLTKELSSAATKKEVETLRKTQVKHEGLWKCHYPFVARKHVTWFNKVSHLDNGQLRSVTFIKKQENTVLRLLYSSAIQEYQPIASYWYLNIDGQDCSRPSPIKIVMHHDRRNQLHLPSILLGTCEATARGRIGKGRHTISVHIKGRSGISASHTTNSFLEIREICK